MKSLTRLFYVSLTILAIVGLLFYAAPVTKAAESYELDGYVYQLDKQDCATIIAYKGTATFLIIPKELDGHPVVSIGEFAFSGNKTLRSAAIPEGVTEIKSYAFSNCTSIFIVGLPDTLTRIGVDAFAGCTSLREISIPKQVEANPNDYLHNGAFANSGIQKVVFEEGATKVPKALFRNAKQLEEVVLPDGINCIEADAFRNCESLKSINLPQRLTVIESSAFQECISLAAIALPESLEIIGANSFADCTSLKEIRIPMHAVLDSLGIWGDGAFANSGIQKVIFEEGATKVPQYMFKNATMLEEVILPEGITTIEGCAFQGCTKLSRMILPESLTYIAGNVFTGCASLKEITIPKQVENIAPYYGTNGPFAGSGIRKVVFAKGTTVIPSLLFAGASELEEVVFADTITEINSQAFYGCEKLQSVILPDYVTKIGDNAFYGCTSLAEVQLPEYLASIGEKAFGACTALMEIHIPKSLSKYGGSYVQYGAFIGSGLKKAVFEEGTAAVPAYFFMGAAMLEEVVLPETVNSIGKQSFYGCSSLSTVRIPDSVRALGEYAFKNCTSMKTVELGTGLNSIPKQAFYGCVSLEKLMLPDAIDAIQESAFEGCTGLREIHWGNMLTKITSYAFRNCDALELTTLPETVTELGYGAFYDCDGLPRFVVPGSITKLGDYVFYDCDALEEVILRTGLTSISSGAFEHCDALISVNIHYGLKTISSKAFKECISLDAVTVPRTVEKIDASAFSYPGMMTCYGVPGTYVETFAADNEIDFVCKEVMATNVTMESAELMVPNGTATTMRFNVAPLDFTDEVVWKSSDPNIVSVTGNGQIKALRTGSATIKITVGGVSASCEVTVVTGIDRILLNQKTLTMNAMDTFQLVASVSPANAYNKTVTWYSTNPSVATVDQNGLVIAVGKGSAQIKAVSSFDNRRTVACDVIVTGDAHVAEQVQNLESPHNYPDTCTDFWLYTLEDAEVLYVTFDQRTIIEDGFDELIIFAMEADCFVEVGRYSGGSLSGQTVQVQGSTVKIQIISDGSGNAWGFKVTHIVSTLDHIHDYETTIMDATCTSSGCTTYSCACGEHYTDNETEALGHNFLKGSCIRCGETDPDYTVPAENPFDDVKETDYFFDPVLWAVKNGITSGTGAGQFSPDQTCTRAQVVTFLWRSVGKPAPKLVVNPFTDVTETDYFYKAVLWAVENNITSGTGAGKFSPDDPCTRDQVVTFLWRAMEKPVAENRNNPFNDIAEGAYYYEPVLWAVENGITSGTSATTFAPSEPCTRGQVVTFLYRAMKDK